MSCSSKPGQIKSSTQYSCPVSTNHSKLLNHQFFFEYSFGKASTQAIRTITLFCIVSSCGYRWSGVRISMCVFFKYQYAKEKNNKTEQSSVKLRQPRVCTVFICVKSLWVSHTGLCCHVLEGTPSDSLTRYVHNPLHCAPTPPVLVCYSGFSR